MKRLLGITLALLFALPLAVGAEDVTGKVKSVDRKGYAFVLEDGTRLWVNEAWLDVLQEGDKVEATYATVEGKKVVTDIQRRTMMDTSETTNFGGVAP